MNRYQFAALAAFSIWGFFALALKPMDSFQTETILAWRVLFAAGFLTLGAMLRPSWLIQNISTFRAYPKAEFRRVLSACLWGGVFLSANWYFFILAMNTISVKTASFAYLISPILTAFFSFLFLREAIRPKEWLSLLICLFASAVLGYGHFQDMVYSLVVALSYSAFLISQRRNVHGDKLFVLLLQMFVALAVLGMLGMFRAAPEKSGFFFSMIALIALVFTILPLALNLYALKGATAASIGILLYINPLINFLLSWLVYHEPVTRTHLWAYMLILISVIIFSYKPKERT